jgi:hypothetical protein
MTRTDGKLYIPLKQEHDAGAGLILKKQGWVAGEQFERCKIVQGLGRQGLEELACVRSLMLLAPHYFERCSRDTVPHMTAESRSPSNHFSHRVKVSLTLQIECRE